MTIKELKSKTDFMIENFVNCLGFDGKFYVSCMNCPIVFGPSIGLGQFFAAESDELNNYLNKFNISKEKKEKILASGLIVVDSHYKEHDADMELISTLIHETFHANRMLVINTQSKPNENIESVVTIDNHFVQASASTESHFVDPNQEVVHGSIDTSREAINKVSLIPKKDLEDLSFADEEVHSKMWYYQTVDEALIELMTIITCCLIKDNTTDIMKIILDINSSEDFDEDVKYVTNIILRHNNLDLLKWMIDPLTYQADDINYDYLKKYFTDDDYIDLSHMVDYIPNELENIVKNCKL